MGLPTVINNKHLALKGRRQFLRNALALSVSSGLAAWPFATQATVSEMQEPVRFALLVGNGDYPVPFDLPPMHKNVMDLGEALAYRGFDVTQALDLDAAGLALTIRDFIKRLSAQPNAVALFYYSGHGMQLNARNLLLGAGSNLTLPKEELLTKSIVLQNNLLAALPQRDTDLNITVIDACRTDLRNALGDEDGFNQVEAPLGSLVCFSTGAGKAAISPASANQNTFFTASLVKLLRESEDHTTFNDLFRFVKADVYKTMSNHPVAAIRTLAQVPFIADNTRLQVPLKWRSSAFESPVEKAMSQEELDKWKELDAQCWPVDIVRLGKAFLASYPQSALSSKVQLIVQGAQEALSVLRNKEVRLYKASFVLPESYSNEQTALELVKAGRGDKDAAVRIARAYRLLQTEQAMLRFEGWMQYATGLGNGIASYELALYYREAGLALPAAQAEAQAKVLGYVPPRSLGHVRS